MAGGASGSGAPIGAVAADGLARFVAAQDPVMPQVLAELAAGRKRTHWMWFVFPQLAGLGRSAMAQRYALACLDEARAYLAHPVLGPRLLRCTGLVNETAGRMAGLTARDVFGSPDDLKLHSCMTLFALAAPTEAAFRTTLDRCFGGRLDAGTVGGLAVRAAGDAAGPG